MSDSRIVGTVLRGVCLLGVAAGPACSATLRVPTDHATIQSAVDAASSGDTVLVAAGTYRERIVLQPGVTLRSVGDDTKGVVGLKRAEETVVDGRVDGAEGAGVAMAARAVLDGFTVTNVGEYDDAEWKKHWKSRGEEQKHEHIGHFGTPGVGIVGVTCVVRHCIVHHNGDTGIAIRGVEGKDCSPLVAHNVCHRNMGGGIGSMRGSTALIERNTCFENFFAGIGHDGASPVVRFNVCHGNVRAGIGISEGACPVVGENVCYENRRAGIGTRSGSETQPVVERNECYENGMAGIGADEEAQPVIRGNRCHHNELAGIGSQHGASPVVVGNDCWENGAAGIGVRGGARPVVVRNVSRENASAGIGVRGAETKAVIVGNRCVENRLVALGLPDGAQAVVVDNHFERTGGMPPLVAVKGGATGVLVRNTLHGGGVATLLVDGNATVVDNDFRAAKPGRGTGVWMWKQTTAVVAGNRFHGHQFPVKPSADTKLIDHANERVDPTESNASVE